jgi:hypothetical protein
MPDESDEIQSQQLALTTALLALLQPLARLAMSQGLPYSAVEELLKQSFVQDAREAQPDPTAQRIVSRISTATGISRREVARLCGREPRAMARPRSAVAQVFAHWTTAREYRDRRGAPRTLPRLGPGPSFEALAQSVTRHVHPRSLLDEMLRFGLVTHDAARDNVMLQRTTFVPRGDATRMLGFVGDNVGDHLNAAVQNVSADGRRHFEQAIFADELSIESLREARKLVRTQWHNLIDSMVPQLEKMIADDGASDRVRNQRLRVGLYSFDETMPAVAASANAMERPTRSRSRRAKDPSR